MSIDPKFIELAADVFRCLQNVPAHSKPGHRLHDICTPEYIYCFLKYIYWYVFRHYDRHFIIGGALSTTPHTAVRLKTASNSKLLTPPSGCHFPTKRTKAVVWKPARRQLLRSIKVGRTSLGRRPHRYLLLPRPEQRPRRLCPGPARLRCRYWYYRYHVCYYSSYCCCAPSPDNQCRYRWWLCGQSWKLPRTGACVGISKTTRTHSYCLRRVVVLGVG